MKLKVRSFFFLVQMQLYEDFSKSQAQKQVEEELEGGGASGEGEESPRPPITHVFQVSPSQVAILQTKIADSASPQLTRHIFSAGFAVSSQSLQPPRPGGEPLPPPVRQGPAVPEEGWLADQGHQTRCQATGPQVCTSEGRGGLMSRVKALRYIRQRGGVASCRG